jgi:hypothetical protein
MEVLVSNEGTRSRSAVGPENAQPASAARVDVRPTLTSNRYVATVTIALAVVGILAAVALLALHPHVSLLQDAFNTHPPAGPTGLTGTTGDVKDTTNLWKEISSLSTDATYVLMPTVTLAGAVGGIFWAVGARRGPAIVGGAVMAGVIGAGLDVIVK